MNNNPFVEAARVVRRECLNGAPAGHQSRQLEETTDMILAFLGAKSLEDVKDDLNEALSELRLQDPNDVFAPFRAAVKKAAKSLGKSSVDIFIEGAQGKSSEPG